MLWQDPLRVQQNMQKVEHWQVGDRIGEVPGVSCQQRLIRSARLKELPESVVAVARSTQSIRN
jgi:hypothetical protein